MLARIIYISKVAGKNNIKISLTIKEDIPKNSAILPQTPDSDLSIDDFLNFSIFQM